MYEELVSRLKGQCYDCKLWDGKKCCLKGECSAQTRLQAADAIEELSKPKWIPVTERLPSNGTNVLVFEFGRVEQAYTTTYTADRSLCWVVINGGSYHRISDADCPIKWWMPLPKPPKESEP